MAHKESQGLRKPMSDEAKAKIAEAVKFAAQRKRQEMGLPPAGFPLAPRPDYIEKPLELVRMSNQEFPDDLFIPMKTGKAVDFLFTNEGGIPKACNFMLIGDPGVGKSTVSLDILSDLALAGYSVLFISAEMTRIDLYGYVKRFPKFGEVDILFIGEYCDSNSKTVIDKILEPGYDIVLIDSFAEVQEDIKESLRLTTSGAEKWLIDSMVSHNLGNNLSRKNTTFIAIQQVTKGGVFVGSNKLKHNTTGMLELRLCDVHYDVKRFGNDENARETLASERAQLENEEGSFNELFGMGLNEENEIGGDI